MVVAEAGAPRLVVTEPAEQAGLVLTLSGPQLVIGHSETADLVLADRFVSRRHALVAVDPSGEVTITDLNSTGGTFVNDERLTGPRVLRPGDLVRFADLVARFEPGSPARMARRPDQEIAAAPARPGAAAETVLVAAAGGAGGGRPVTGRVPGGGVPGGGLPGAGPAAGGPASPDAGRYTVTGTVASPALPGVGGLTVELVDKNVGGDQVLASTQTSSDGSYAFSQVAIGPDYLERHSKVRPDLQVRVSAAGRPVGASTVRYSAPPVLSLDVVLPAGAAGLPTEYETLTANLAAVYPGSLGALREEAGRQDITYLANKTGWDARAVALAALAHQFSEITAPAPATSADPHATGLWPAPTVSLPPEYYYALFRAGLPANADGLFRVSPATVGAIWQRATAAGVIPAALAEELPQAVARFHALSAAHTLTAVPPAGPSTLAQMLTPALPDPARQQEFAQLHAQYQGDWPVFWREIERALGPEVTRQLRLMGQLYYLTANNQPLVAALMQAEVYSPISSVLDLVSRGYYEPARWTALIGSDIPPGIPGAGPGDRTGNYARLLAAQMRVAFPTAVLADQIRRNILPVAGTPDVAAGVADFLTANQGQFEIGVEPVDAYLARTGLTGTPADVISQINRLQRVYQLTPDDASLAVLLQHNLDSAFAVTRYDSAGFARALGEELGGADTATAIHARARQIFASTLSVAVGYLTGRVSPSPGGRVPVHYGFWPQAAPPPYPVTAYPTLEDLFGAQDYCNCTDCGSILGPAAYLVDLLNYIDQPAPSAGSNPQDVLFARRPDLAYLPLTCENTNTALPYIDIVNETLEYFVANGISLANYRGHDTGESVTSAELIGSPQYVDDDAYAMLQNAFFPPPLPFSRPLALLRLQLDGLGVALPDAMAALRAGDQLIDRSTLASYGWLDIGIERLAISRDEYRLFTDPALGLADLYGLPTQPAPLTVLQTMSLQDFSRRLGVSYAGLSSMIGTRFINPNAWLLPRLERLNAPFAILKALHDNLGTPGSIEAEFIGALPAGLDATAYGGASPTDYAAVVAWVTSPRIYPLIMNIITITSPGGTADDCSGAALQLRYSNPDSSANLLSGTDFIKLIRFVRLWRKLSLLLGYADDALSIERTDDILAALYPSADIPAWTGDIANDPANRALLDTGFAILLPRLGFLFQAMGLLSVTAPAALVQLLACWAPIGTTGASALYRTMFGSPTQRQQDPGAQTATVASTVSVGDVLRTRINGSEQVAPRTVQAGQTAAAVAVAIAGDINAATAADPISGLPLNSRFHASSAGGVITVRAGFTFACSLSAGATETYTAAAGTPVSRTATVAGPATPGDTLTTTLDGIAIPYTVTTADTLQTIAAGIAAAINATTVPDPYSGLPMNGLLAASSAAAVVTVITVNAGAPFTLACSADPPDAGAYVAGRLAPPFADNGYGEFLSDPTQTLFGHEPAVCAACNLTSADFALIADELRFDPGTPLTLDAVSTMLRFGWLAHALGLSVLEFLRLRRLTGLDPFAPLDPGTTPPAEPPVIRLIRLLGALAAAGLNIAQALYLIWNSDISEISAPPQATITGLALALRADFAAVEAEFSLKLDPDGSIAQGLMTLVYGSSASGFFFGLLNGTFSTSVTYSAPPAASHPPAPGGQPGAPPLPEPVVAASAGRLRYDDVSKQLSFAGVLDAATEAAIAAAIPVASDPALASAVAALAAASQRAVGPFFSSYPELRPLYAAYAASADPAQARRTALLGSFLPILKLKRKQEQALSSITSASGTDPSFAPSLLTDPTILHSDAEVTAAAIADLVAVEDQGLSAQFFLGNDTAAVPDQVYAAVPVLSYAQTLTIGGTITTGDVLKTTINGVAIDYAVGAADTTTALLAGRVAAAINATTAADPVTALPLNQVVTATASQNVVTVAGLDQSGANSYFALAAAASAGATETFTAGSHLPAGHGGGDIAGVWGGYLTVPQDGFYDINVAADPGAQIVLWLGAATVAGTQAGGLWASQSPISLVAGQLVPITLTASSIKTTLSVSWRSEGLGWQPIPGAYCYSLSRVGSLGNTYVRFLKAASLAGALSLTAAEIAYLGTAPDISPGWLGSLAAQGDPDLPTAARLTAVLTALLDFSALKQALSPGDGRLLAVLQNPAATLPDSQSALLSLTGWTQASVDALLTHLFGSTDPASLSSVANFRRVFDAYSIVRTSRLTASALIAAITNAPSATTVSALQSALRARYAEPDWLTVIGPINDQARIIQRDALVAYILQRLGDSYAQSLVRQTTSAGAATGATTLTCAGTGGITGGMGVRGTGIATGTTVTAIAGDAVTISQPVLAALPAGTWLTFVPPDALAIDTADRLYELFLIDPQTQPPVLTSRIRLALSAVQLFVERVARNLEPEVSPADIDAAQWTWMKRYRVWQANREVFLWPENWLYPELRDNASPLFAQMMSSLLQGDVTDDAAADAYLDYLTGLEEVAKLEPCGMYYQPGSADTDEATYVVSRTAGAHRKYFFRELTSGSWTPWAEVKIDCEGMPVTPVVWNGRLFLFWLKTTKQAVLRQASLGDASPAIQNSEIASLGMGDLQTYAQASALAAGKYTVLVQAALCWTEYYNRKWQPAKTSDASHPSLVGYFDVAGPGSFEACRDQVRIVPAKYTGTNPLASALQVQFSLPADTLMLAITVASQSYNAGGFILHNTHSLPVILDDMAVPGWQFAPLMLPLLAVLDIPSPSRSFPAAQPYTGGYGSGTFAISYEATLGGGATDASNVLNYNWQPRWIDVQPGLPDAWDAPFIYEDRRHLFYVTTTESIGPIYLYQGFGMLASQPVVAATHQVFPPLVLRQPVVAATPQEILAVGATGGDPLAIQRYLAQGTNINAALPSQLTVTYQGQRISAIGSLGAPSRDAGEGA